MIYSSIELIISTIFVILQIVHKQSIYFPIETAFHVYVGIHRLHEIIYYSV